VATVGRSNVTLFVTDGAGARTVLRRPPFGPHPPSAHDVIREARVMRALRDTGVPVPRVLSTCESDEAIGAPFYVM
jgi:aminoglycoside phosphotransferase (APT) family kinase protein